MTRDMSITRRTVLMTSLILFLSIVSSGLFVTYQNAANERTLIKEKLSSFVDFSSKRISEALINGDIYSLNLVISKFCSEYKVKGCRILDVEKEVVLVYPDLLRAEDVKGNFFILPIFHTGKPMGWMEVHYDEQSLMLPTKSKFIPILVFALVLAVVGLLLAYLIILKPFKKLDDVSNALDGKNIDEALERLSTVRSPIAEINFLLKTIVTRLTTSRGLEFKVLEMKKFESIAQTTQMLAHDVRKPFTMVQGLLEILRTADPKDIPGIVTAFTPEVKSSIHTVNGMLNDVMEVGNNSEPVKDPVNVGTIVLNVINDNLRFNEKADIMFSYDFNHKSQLNVGTLSVSRVLSNILDNGIQAMNSSGRIWITTSEKDNFITLTIGNSGSFICQDDIENLFDAFFTKHKKSGTGLGLAIAKKVVTDHGGEIWCASDKSKGTEFYFTLPTSVFIDNFTEPLPSSAREVREHYVALANQLEGRSESGSSRSEEDVTEAIIAAGQKVSILVCDDEAVYRNIIESHLVHSGDLKEWVDITFSDTGEEAIRLASSLKPDLVVMDVDLGIGFNGFEAVKKLRDSGSMAKICIHSNRGVLEYQKDTVDAGADLFLPKPMTRKHFLDFILGVSLIKSGSQSEKTNLKVEAEEKPYYIVVDDSQIMLMTWRQLGESHDFKTFHSPEEFFDAIHKNSDLMFKASGIITDQNFDEISSVKGLEFAVLLRGKGYKGPIYLCSNGDFSEEELAEASVKLVPKMPQDAILRLEL